MFSISRCGPSATHVAWPHELRDRFATNLRRIRHSKGMSQDELAYNAEISRSYLSQLEKGKFYASLKIIGRLAEVLRVDPAEFLLSVRRRD